MNELSFQEKMKLDRYALFSYAKQRKRFQVEAVCGALMTEHPVMPPDGIYPLRWKAMVNSYKSAIAQGLTDEI